jgi:hypothetical protein
MTTSQITLFELLKARGFDGFDNARMVRHEDRGFDLQALRDEGQFDFYQGYQSSHIFNRDYMLAFFGRPNRRAVFYGLYRVKGHRMASTFAVPPNLKDKYKAFHTDPGRIWYDLDEVPGFEALRDRVVIGWGMGTRSWCQKLRNRDVLEVLPSNYAREWPGYLQVMLTHKELCGVIADAQAYREWHRALSATAGVYLILDTKSGKHYVGSATSEEGGILQRWANYAKNPGATNVLLRKALIAGETAVEDWQYTILQNLPRTMTPKEVIGVEGLYKNKLGTRLHGWNAN